MEKRLLKLSNRLIDSLVFLCLLTAFVYAAYALWDVDTIYSHAEASNFTEYKPSADSPASRQSFEELRKLNPDVLGWLTIYDTAIDYPLVQTDDNFTYLDTTVEGEYSAAGSLYLDYRNQPDFSDWNTIIHGHHMAAHAMFGDIGLYEQQDHFDRHRLGDLYYDGRHYGLEIFALALTDTSDRLLFSPALETEGERQLYLDRLGELSRQQTDLEVTPSDRILVMATCSNIITNGRHLLVAKILDDPVANPFPESASKDALRTGRTGMVSLFSVGEDSRPTTLLLLLSLVFMLCLLLYMILELRLSSLNQQSKYRARSFTSAGGGSGRPKSRPNPVRYFLIPTLCLSFLLALSAPAGQVAALESSESKLGEAVELDLSFNQTIYSKYYGAEPNPDTYIHYELRAKQADNPMPGGGKRGCFPIKLRVGDGNFQQQYKLEASFPTLKITGRPPREYDYTLRAVAASGPGADLLALDQRVYEIKVCFLALPGGETKLLLVLGLPEGKPSEISFCHSYLGPSQALESELSTGPKPPGSGQVGGGKQTVTTVGAGARETQKTKTEKDKAEEDKPQTGETGSPPWLLLVLMLTLAYVVSWRLYLSKRREHEQQGE